MKRQTLCPRARNIISLIHSSCTLWYIKPPKTVEQKARVLAELIDTFSEVYFLNPRAPHHIRLEPFQGIPFLNQLSQPGVLESFVANQALIPKG